MPHHDRHERRCAQRMLDQRHLDLNAVFEVLDLRDPSKHAVFEQRLDERHIQRDFAQGRAVMRGFGYAGATPQGHAVRRTEDHNAGIAPVPHGLQPVRRRRTAVLVARVGQNERADAVHRRLFRGRELLIQHLREHGRAGRIPSPRQGRIKHGLRTCGLFTHLGLLCLLRGFARRVLDSRTARHPDGDCRRRHGQDESCPGQIPTFCHTSSP